MKLSLRNCLLVGRKFFHKRKRGFLVILLIVVFTCSEAQVVNYINNAGFEITLPSFTLNPFDAVKFWGPIDTTKNASFLFSKVLPLNNAPYCSTGFQFPRSGNNFILSQFFCNTCIRFYPRNRLKHILKYNVTYCAKYYIVNTNNNRIAIDSYGMYFGNNTVDTITQCQLPLVFLSPQIENTTGNIIKDTMNWIPITGTFVANGTEKYAILGNFKSNISTNTLIINTPTQTIMSNDIYIDDVSLIELELPAYAGRDTTCIPGTSVYLGRQSDVEIDESCRWYKLPITITPTTPAIDTAAGIWVSPTQTSTYVVRQQLWCSGVKWDTVVVYEDHVGLDKTQLLNDRLKLFPNPTKDELKLTVEDENLFKDFLRVSVYDKLGSLIREEDLMIKNKTAYLNTESLPDGAYYLSVKNKNALIINKGFFVSH